MLMNACLNKWNLGLIECLTHKLSMDNNNRWRMASRQVTPKDCLRFTDNKINYRNAKASFIWALSKVQTLSKSTMFLYPITIIPSKANINRKIIIQSLFLNAMTKSSNSFRLNKPLLLKMCWPSISENPLKISFTSNSSVTRAVVTGRKYKATSKRRFRSKTSQQIYWKI